MIMVAPPTVFGTNNQRGLSTPTVELAWTGAALNTQRPASQSLLRKLAFALRLESTSLTTFWAFAVGKLTFIVRGIPGVGMLGS
jgi:hypothetical protein